MTNSTEITVGDRRLVIQHDPLPADGSPLPAAAVVGPGGASRTLLHLTPRRPVGRVWDLGCGSGVQAVAAATHAREVIATDVDPRCLEFTQASAAANGLHIKTRLGSLFDPVAGEQFDLVVANPPFVIGQVTNLGHRESPLAADGLTAALLEQLPGHLAADGMAVLLTAWLTTSSQDWQDRIGGFLSDDCSAWVGLRELQTPTEYVETWLRDAGIIDEKLAAEWLARLESWDATGIAFGWVVLTRDGQPAWHELEDLRAAAAIPSGEEVLARLAAARQAADLTAPQLLAGRFRAAGSQAWRGEVSLEPVLAVLRSKLDGSQSLSEAVDSMAAEFKFDADDLVVLALAGVKELVSLGLVEPL